MGEQNFSNNFVGGRGGYSKCVESFINEFSPNMVKYSLED